MSDKTVSCPNCQADVIWNEQAMFRPFCSHRCKLIDLGAWANDEHSIPGEQPTWDQAIPVDEPN